ncbi:MAG: hypothetical protein P4L87_21210 [Formivibrio sp.]|nr:hypothetical protein [Formivibrio sp.]
MPESVPILTEGEVVRLIHEHIGSLFPKICAKCNRHFASYQDYLANTKAIGLPVSYDLEAGEVKPSQSQGNLSLANCHCDNTLSLSSDGMLVTDLWMVLKWITLEADRRKSTIPTVLSYLRDAVTTRELGSHP